MRGKARFALVIGRHQPLAKGGKVGQHHRVEIIKRLRQAQARVGEHGVLGGGAHLGFVVHGAAQGKKLTLSQRFGHVHHAVGAQHAAGFVERGGHVLARDMVQRVEKHHDVGAGVGSGQGLTHAFDDGFVGHPCGRVRGGQLARAAFHPQHLRAVAGQVTHQMAIAAANVDQLFAGHRQGVGEHVRVAANRAGVGHGGRL